MTQRQKCLAMIGVMSIIPARLLNIKITRWIDFTFQDDNSRSEEPEYFVRYLSSFDNHVPVSTLLSANMVSCTNPPMR